MTKGLRPTYWLLLTLLTLCACSHASTESNGERDSDTVASTVVTATEVTLPVDSLPTLSVQQIDSLRFRLTHHYTENTNFLVKSDSLRLLPRQGDTTTDTCCVHDGDLIAVARIHVQTAQDSLSDDTVWVKVARDQQTMGWVEEQMLLRNVVPDDPISQILDTLTYSRALWMSLLVLLGILGLWFTRGIRVELPSPYPTLLLILVAVTAAAYASVQNFAPEYWLEYYFHPTMNPLLLPPVMAVLVTLVWTLLIVTLAVVIEVYNHLSFGRGILYLFQLAGTSMVVYLLISWCTLIYIGYLLLPLLVVGLIAYYRRRVRCTLQCGHCGRPLRGKGVCPGCGALND